MYICEMKSHMVSPRLIFWVEHTIFRLQVPQLSVYSQSGLEANTAILKLALSIILHTYLPADYNLQHHRVFVRF